MKTETKKVIITPIRGWYDGVTIIDMQINTEDRTANIKNIECITGVGDILHLLTKLMESDDFYINLGEGPNVVIWVERIDKKKIKLAFHHSKEIYEVELSMEELISVFKDFIDKGLDWLEKELDTTEFEKEREKTLAGWKETVKRLTA